MLDNIFAGQADEYLFHADFQITFQVIWKPQIKVQWILLSLLYNAYFKLNVTIYKKDKEV